jgi:hypothetical protein
MVKKPVSKNGKNAAKKAGLGAGINKAAENYAENVVFSAERGHGFAAEKANHLHDKFMGKDAKLVGSDNV